MTSDTEEYWNRRKEGKNLGLPGMLELKCWLKVTVNTTWFVVFCNKVNVEVIAGNTVTVIQLKPNTANLVK